MESTAPNPEQFAVYDEAEDGSGFFTPDGKYYEFDEFNGWYDEHGNYYNQNGEPSKAPEYEEDEEGYEPEENLEDFVDDLVDEYEMGANLQDPEDEEKDKEYQEVMKLDDIAIQKERFITEIEEVMEENGDDDYVYVLIISRKGTDAQKLKLELVELGLDILEFAYTSAGVRVGINPEHVKEFTRVIFDVKNFDKYYAEPDDQKSDGIIYPGEEAGTAPKMVVITKFAQKNFDMIKKQIENDKKKELGKQDEEAQEVEED